MRQSEAKEFIESQELGCCPFCGGNKMIIETWAYAEGPRYRIECASEGCEAIGPKAVDPIEAVFKWNYNSRSEL